MGIGAQTHGDAAAGILLIQEAGGTLTGAAGEPYSLGDRVLVASNGHLHMKLVTLMGLGEVLA